MNYVLNGLMRAGRGVYFAEFAECTQLYGSRDPVSNPVPVPRYIIHGTIVQLHNVQSAFATPYRLMVSVSDHYHISPLVLCACRFVRYW